MDRTLDEVSPEEYDAVELPGGALNADQMRMNRMLQSFLQSLQNAGKPFSVICHAPWELISAGLVKGRTLTSYHTIQDDVLNAGARWVDQEVVVDNNWVTSLQPADIPAFNREMIKLFASHVPVGTRR
jgi:protease I